MREASKLVGVCRVVFAAGLLVVGACSPKITPGPVYDGEPAREKAMAYMGAPVNMSMRDASSPAVHTMSLRENWWESGCGEVRVRFVRN